MTSTALRYNSLVMAAWRVTAVGVLALTVGCARMREVFEPAQFIAAKRPPVVVVMQRSRAVVAIVNPRVSGDSVLGTVAGETRPIAVPFSDVHSVSAVRLDGVRTMLFAVGVTATASLVAYAFVTRGSQHDWYCDYNTSVLDATGAPLCGPRQ